MEVRIKKILLLFRKINDIIISVDTNGNPLITMQFGQLQTK